MTSEIPDLNRALPMEEIPYLNVDGELIPVEILPLSAARDSPSGRIGGRTFLVDPERGSCILLPKGFNLAPEAQIGGIFFIDKPRENNPNQAAI